MESKERSNRPSGLLLIDLVCHHIHKILDREARNRQMILLYRTGVYWTAFERSAYRLEQCCGDASVFPMRIQGISHSVVIASIEDDCLEAALRSLETMQNEPSEKVFRMRDELDETVYRRWHTRKSAFIEEAMQEIMIIRRPGFLA